MTRRDFDHIIMPIAQKTSLEIEKEKEVRMYALQKIKEEKEKLREVRDGNTKKFNLQSGKMEEQKMTKEHQK